MRLYKILIAASALLLGGISAHSQEVTDSLSVPPAPQKTYTRIYLDTVNVKRKLVINDYSMLGIHYGVSLSQMMFNPGKKQGMLILPNNFGITYTKYGKLFGIYPYFGIQVGLFYGEYGYKFKKDKETGKYTESVDGAIQAKYKYVEVPLLSQFHIDLNHFKLLGHAGLYAGYRLSVERVGLDDSFDSKYLDHFYDYDKRMDYGVKAGLGFGLVFNPIEIHFQGSYRWSWASLYEPDYNSQYYYRFAYPSDIMVSVGLYVQLSRRSGRSKAQLRQEARQKVYNPSFTVLGEEE